MVSAVCLAALSTGCGSDATKLAKHARQHAGQTHARQVAVARPTWHSPRHRYAVQILPTLDRSVAEFDRTVRAVASKSDLSALDGVCGYYGARVNILASSFDGIPHPWAWYTPLGYLHHTTMDVYGYMLGAIQACQTAASSDDPQGAGTAISDMATAANKLHGTDNYVRWLTHQP